MFKFKAKFLRRADQSSANETPSGSTELNGLTIIPLDAFVKEGSATAKQADESEEDDVEEDDKKGKRPGKKEPVVKRDEKAKEPKVEDKKKKPEQEFGLGATHRPLSDDEMREFLTRVKNKDKNKLDPYTMPYVHHNNVQIVDGSGNELDLAALKKDIMQRPSTLLKQNEKMQHSDGSATQFYNVGLPALKGLAVNEKTGEFVVVDTCPGSGACKTFCYAMKGSYIMFKATSMLQTRTLNFLLNNPEAFKNRLKAEIAMKIASNEEAGNEVIIRWHDAGDFFSPQYMELAFDVARAFPDIKFYAYTKMSGVANAKKPDNFTINFSEGALPREQKQVQMTKIKHSVVVPKDMFYDLIAREGRNIIKSESGQTQFKDEAAWEEFKDRIAAKYKINRDTILSYNEYMEFKAEDELGEEPHHWNVIVPPGAGDNSATDNAVLGTYLLFH